MARRKPPATKPEPVVPEPDVTDAPEYCQATAVIDRTCSLLEKLEGLHDGDPSTKDIFEIAADPAGIATVGFGHALFNPDTGRPLYLSRHEDRRIAYEMYPEGVTLGEARAILRGDVVARYASARQDATFAAATEDEQVALLSFIFNIGVHNYRKSTLRVLIEAGQVECHASDFATLYKQMVSKLPPLEIDEAFTAWSRTTLADGRRTPVEGLFTRRYIEFLIFTGTPEDEAVEAGRKALKEFRHG